MIKYKNYMIEPEYQEPRTSFTKKVVGAAVGAAAGRYVAGKLATINVDRAKTVGTGLGAIAGYWAAGRSKR
jgi:hypothetical protein